MNKTLLTIFTICIAIVSSSAQVIPNAGFEDWHPYASGEYPDYWTTDDSVSVALGAGNNVFKTTDSYEGTYAIYMKSVTTPFVSGPGIATNGVMAINTSTQAVTFTGGSPDTARSRFLSGYFKYNPLGANDMGFIRVSLLRDVSGVKDTIATGITWFSGTTSTYTQFVTQLNYYDFVNQPDTCLIIIQSSKAINDPDLASGTELQIDSLNFGGFVGIDELKSAISSVSVYPTPADKDLFVDVKLKNNISLSYEIYDLHGKRVLTSSMNSNHERIDVSLLSSGNYILNLGDAKKNRLYSTSFSIAR